MRILFACGGTGGHIYPALAMAQTVLAHDPEAAIAFVGTERGKEKELVSREGFPIDFIKIRGIRRSVSPKAVVQNLDTLRMAHKAVKEAEQILSSFLPDVVIGTGGYACYPTVRAAIRCHIPTILHESNAAPGMAVRFLHPYVDRVLTNFAVTENRLPYMKREKIKRVGNPIRADFTSCTREEAREKLGIPADAVLTVSSGGSGGAEKINEAILDAMRGICDRPDLMLVHATGTRDWENFESKFREERLDKAPNLRAVSYLYDMPLWMTAADMVICRAGAMTLSEVALLGKPSIIIPSENVTENHQFKNADALRRAGAAVLIEEKNLNGQTLLDAVFTLAADEEKRKTMGKNAASFVTADTSEKIWREICAVIRN